MPPPRFVDVVARELATTGLEVLHDHTDAPTAATTSDKRIGAAGRGGTFSGNYTRGLDSALDRGTSKASRLGSGAAVGAVTVDTAGALDLGYVFTMAMVVRFRRFGAASALVRRAGTAIQWLFSDEGTSTKLYLQRAGGSIITTSTWAISDTWMHHLVIASMNGSGSVNPRLLLDGVEGHGSVTAVSNAGAPGVFTYPGIVATDSIAVSAFAAWSRQLSVTEELRLWEACQFDYRPRPVRVGLHSGIGAYQVSQQGDLIDHDGDRTGLAARSNRFGFRWQSVQATDGGFSDWTKLEHAVDRSLAHGMTVLGVFETMPTYVTGGANEWAIDPVQANHQADVDRLATEFVPAVVRRFKDRVHHWECGNEPNLRDQFWIYSSGNPSATQHAQDNAYYQNAIRQAILAEDPSAEISTAGITSWAGVGAGNVTGEAMLRNLHANGLSTLFRRYAIHPYNYSTAGSPIVETEIGGGAIENNVSDVLKLWDLLVELGRHQVGGVDSLIDITECGWFDLASLTADRIRDMLVLFRNYFSRRLGSIYVFTDADRTGNFTGLSSEWAGSGMGFVPTTTTVQAGSPLTLVTLNVASAAAAGFAPPKRFKVGRPGAWQVFDFTGRVTSGQHQLTGVTGLEYVPPTDSIVTNELVRKTAGDEFRKFALAYST